MNFSDSSEKGPNLFSDRLRHAYNALRLAVLQRCSLTAMYEDEPPPPLTVRWMRPQTASAILELPTAPITSISQKDIGWQAFTAEESELCEAAWQKLSSEDRRRAEEGEDEDDEQRTSNDIEDDEEDIVGVSIAKDKLFEVDVRTMRVSLLLLTRQMYAFLTVHS